MRKLRKLILFALLVGTLWAQQPTNIAQFAGSAVSLYATLFSATAATGTATSSTIGIPQWGGFGTLTIVGASITGSPAGCTITIAYIAATGGSATSTQATVSFTPGNSTQSLPVVPTQVSGDQIVATYACGTYPTAGTISVTFAPSPAVSVWQYNTTLPTYSNGNFGVPQIDAKGQALSDFNYVLGALHSKTNSIFTALSDQTNVITAAISALGTAPTGTEVLAVNAVNLPTTAAGGAVSASVKATVTASVNVKASAGNVYGISVANGAAAVCWVQLINSASAGTLGTAVIFSIALPASGVVNIPPGTLALGNFSSGIAVGVASSTNSSTACGTGANITVFYQ